MKKIGFGAQILLGLIYFVFGLNGFLNFIPVPPPPEGALAFMGGLASTGYFFPFLKATEVLGGIALLSNRFVGLASIVLAPITLNIFLYHAILTPGLSNSVLPVIMIVLSLIVAYSHKEKFSGILAAK